MKPWKPSECLKKRIGSQFFSHGYAERPAVEVVQDGRVVRFIELAEGGGFALGAMNQFGFFLQRRRGGRGSDGVPRGEASIIHQIAHRARGAEAKLEPACRHG